MKFILVLALVVTASALTLRGSEDQHQGLPEVRWCVYIRTLLLTHTLQQQKAPPQQQKAPPVCLYERCCGLWSSHLLAGAAGV